MDTFLIIFLILILIISSILDVLRIKTDKEIEKRLEKLKKDKQQG
ncbi:hypothetical protein [Helicobacter trogontum]|nr:hypothetical protein [Helicobacter trogontum]